MPFCSQWLPKTSCRLSEIFLKQRGVTCLSLNWCYQRVKGSHQFCRSFRSHNPSLLLAHLEPAKQPWNPPSWPPKRCHNQDAAKCTLLYSHKPAMECPPDVAEMLGGNVWNCQGKKVSTLGIWRGRNRNSWSGMNCWYTFPNFNTLLLKTAVLAEPFANIFPSGGPIL